MIPAPARPVLGGSPARGTVLARHPDEPDPLPVGDEERLAGGLRASRREELLRNGHLERAAACGHDAERVVLATVVAQQENGGREGGDDERPPRHIGNDARRVA
jgi:hypothetical protein